MNTYTFILRSKEGEKCCHIPKAIIERNYGLLDENIYTFSIPHRDQNQVIYLSEHPRFKEKKIACEGYLNNKE